MLVYKTKENLFTYSSLHKNRSQLPEEKNLIVPVHQLGRHDVTYKPSISTVSSGLPFVNYIAQNDATILACFMVEIHPK